MLTLAINTSSTVEAVALLKGKKLLGEVSWRANYDESEKLLPAIEKLLKKHGAKWADLSRIVAVNGPGPFSAVRIGVTVANTLAMLTGAKLIALNSLDFWRARAPIEKAALLLHAGSRFVAVCKPKGAVEILPIDDAVHKNASAKTFYGDITADEMAAFNKQKTKDQKFIDQKSLPSFGLTLSKLGYNAERLRSAQITNESAFRFAKCVVPEYFRPPNITSPKKPYK
jgi:tRNA threonylcarbamoyl adenosine modification protein YeaZ